MLQESLRALEVAPVREIAMLRPLQLHGFNIRFAGELGPVPIDKWQQYKEAHYTKSSAGILTSTATLPFCGRMIKGCNNSAAMTEAQPALGVQQAM